MKSLWKGLALILVLSICSLKVLVAQSDAYQLTIDASTSKAKIQPTMYGIFFEDINFAADGGLYAELVKNRGFEFPLPKMGWLEPNSDRHSLNTASGMGTIIKTENQPANRNILRVMVNNDQGYELINEGFRGMGIKEGQAYDLSFQAAKGEGRISQINFQLIGENGKVIGETSVAPTSANWQVYTSVIKADATAEKARLKITFQGTGLIDLDMISLFPQDTWKGRKYGLRKDLVQLLYDMDPGFLRFPGGCIVEGRTLAQRYQWKKTVGPIEEREALVNRWNTEFNHRLTPDYYQSFGLGFFEYFQLAEDIGAEAMPILGCGMACQFNTGELVPMDELGPYVQDALDLIEFANGDVSTPWGKVRSEMGHPEPFNMTYIGIGNEQWGPEYIKRYLVFEEAIKAKYPDIVIISGSGPFPDGEYFEYGMEELTKLNAAIVDEHYYRSPEWFRENATRYDSYDRNGPKIFAGEYAAQSVAIASPDNKNNWNCALSEAAYMTGLERNADLVVMTSYAPLMAHAEGWQWTPDMIWFNNLQAYGTANYYVQKMYANNAGTDLLQVTLDGQPVTGQHQLYASSVMDENTNQVIVKVANTGAEAQSLKLVFNGAKVGKEAEVWTMATDELEAVNSFEEPMKISPQASTAMLKKSSLEVKIPAHAFVVYKIGLR
ncbi:alpha-L-arabinofuranosidase C-terminal domain-containing protein [Lewinella sp. LCG006]|uniref:alpha-L-arabinofuranosidase C-terminal domain-containing protein n=1 Tax=Lewinella sp. LCG006 TaxID=3231911 RepID=UPI00345F7F6E